MNLFGWLNMSFGNMLIALCGLLVAAPVWLVICIVVAVVGLMWWGIGAGGSRRQ